MTARTQLLLMTLVATLGGLTVPVAAEKLTTVAVVDIDKVYEAVFAASKPVRDFEQLKQSIQDELNGYVAELNKLKDQRLDAATKNDTAQMQKLDQDIAQKTQFIAEFRRVKQTQLEDTKKSLSSSDELKQDLDAMIEYVAISEGYTVVLFSGLNTNLYWWSSEVDITQKVIARLKQTGKYQ
jgi:outer membrane protein